MSRAGALRLFWIGAAATLVAAALVSIVAVLAGGFDRTDGKILGALGTVLLGGAVTTVGASLRETYRSIGLGSTLCFGAPMLTVVAIVAIVDDFQAASLGKAAGLAYVLLATGGVVGTARILAKERRQLLLFGLVAGTASLAAALVSFAIVNDRIGSWKVLVATLIVMVLAYVLVPVSRRLAGVQVESAPTRVDLGHGTSVAGVRVRVVQDATTLDSDAVVVVLEGGAAAGSLAVGPGEAVLAPAGTVLEPGADGRVLLVGR